MLVERLATLDRAACRELRQREDLGMGKDPITHPFFGTGFKKVTVAWKKPWRQLRVDQVRGQWIQCLQ